ncbi:unnamed protein product [Mytilus coruscus]|uniref:Uncharacterized protein n=1 Tax=Mytilus coruscus TaxID=42192 RepID=A0A6J8D9Y4_MYTCO|nr:unnamed protein product [Mytilus coruscus]
MADNHGHQGTRKVDVEIVKTEVKVPRDKVENLDSHAQLMDDSIQDIHNTLIPDIEGNQSRRKRTLKVGVRGPKMEFVDEWVFFEKTLEIPKELIEKCCFMPCIGYQEKKEKRKIVVRFNSLIDRDDVLAAGMKLTRGSGESILQGHGDEVAQRPKGRDEYQRHDFDDRNDRGNYNMQPIGPPKVKLKPEPSLERIVGRNPHFEDCAELG